MNLFGTAGIRGRVGESVTTDLALGVGRAVASEAESVVVGRDGRTTGQGLVAAVEAGVLSGGAEALRVGELPTPALAYASRDRHGLMVTASHNPPADDGIKLFVDGEEYNRERERAVERLVADGPDSVAWDAWGESRRVDTLAGYREEVTAFARDHGAALDGLRVAVDCGNGMASLSTPQVLHSLGGDVCALEANVDGHFPARESKPTAESLGHLRSFVAGGDWDLGFGHDGDADRIVVVDGSGEVVQEDTVVAILAGHYVDRSGAADPVVVTTPNASARIDEAVDAAGGRVERVRLGALHEGIDAATGRGGPETEVVFAAEPWKHVHVGLGGWIDGVASAAVFARLVAADGLAALRDPIDERPYRKTEVECPDEDKEAAMALVAERLPDEFPGAPVDYDHGVRLTLSGGSWTLVRQSGTEPYVRIYAESDEVDSLVDRVVAVVEFCVADAG
jgi:phosphomannomutase